MELLVIVGVVALLALILLPLALLRRRASAASAEVAAAVAADGALRGPEKALYRGGSGPYPKVKGNGRIALTEDRLVFRILIGTSVEIPLAEITGVREAKWFQRSYGGQVHLIVQTAAGEVGFFVEDTAAWSAAITAATRRG